MRHYVGQMAAGQMTGQIDPDTGEMIYAGGALEEQRQLRKRCSSFVQYLTTNTPALAAGLQGLPHNNAEYIEQYQQISIEDRELVGECARLAADEMLDAAWESLSPEEQKAHTKWVGEQLAAETAGRPGVSVVCPPGTSPAACLEKIHAAVDAQECAGGIALPVGPVPFCVPAWLLWGAGALLVFSLVRR